MAYVPLTNLVPQFFDNLGNFLVGGTISAFLAGTSTATNMFSDNNGTVAGSVITLDSRGEPTTIKHIWLDGSINYKFVLKDSTGSTIWTVDNIDPQIIPIASQISIVDAGNYYTSTNVEGALQEAATITDAGSYYSATTVSNAFQEVATALYFKNGLTSTVATTVQNKIKEVLSVKDFGAVGNGVANDTTAIQNAINNLPEHAELYFPSGRYYTNGVIQITASNRKINFGNATFLVGDTGANGTLTNGTYGKFGYLFKSITGLVVTGTPKFIGQGTLGVTSLTGMVFDTCTNAVVSAEMYFENMSAGRFIGWCNDSVFGNVEGVNISGLQTLEDPPTSPQGSLEVIFGCVRSRFGNLKCQNHILPARYLSININGSGSAIDNQFCSIGTTSSLGTGLASSTVAVRSAVHCSFGDVVSSSVAYSVLVVIYLGNTLWNVDKNTFGNVTATMNASSTGYGVGVYSEEPLKPIGQLQFSNITVTGSANSLWGMLVQSGKTSVESIYSVGFLRGIGFNNCAFNCSTATISSQNQEAILIGQGANCVFNDIQILSGSTLVTTSAINYSTALGTGGLGVISLGNILYRYNSVGNDYTYIVADLVNGFESYDINNINGSATGGRQARFANDEFFVKRSLWSSTAIPTSGTYSVGTVLFKSNAAAGGVPGWVCTTAGTPGTWKAMANLAV